MGSFLNSRLFLYFSNNYSYRSIIYIDFDENSGGVEKEKKSKSLKHDDKNMVQHMVKI